MLYNPHIVDESVKIRLLTQMLEYDSYYVNRELGIIFSEIVKNCSSAGEISYSSELDELARFYPDDRSVICGFHLLLEKRGTFSPPVTRRPNGTKVKTLLTNPIVGIVIEELKPLVYSIQANTWAATSEEWLKICNADYVASIIEVTKRPMPSETEIAGWMSGWVAFMVEYY